MRSKLSLPSMLSVCLAAVVGCSDGMEPSGGKKDEAGATGGVNEASGSANAAQLEAFTATLYPLLQAHCSECHASVVSPYFAAVDAAAAMTTINGAQLVTLATPDQSRLVKRLTEQAHSCWGDCAENGAEMADAIEDWAVQAGGGEPEQEFIELTSVPISSAGEVILSGGYGNTWVRAAAYPDAYGDRVEAVEDTRASQRRVMYRRPDFATLPDPKPNGGALYYFEIPDSDTATYQLCYRVKTNITLPEQTTPTNHGTRVYANLNGNNIVGTRDLNQGVQPDAQGAAQVNNSYIWMPAFYGVDGMGATVPMAYNLKPMKGSKTLLLNVWDTQPAIDLIALIGSSATCSQAAVPNAGRVYGFAFDLTKALGQKATFSIQYQMSGDGLAQVFSRPTIELADKTAKVHIEEVYVVINDQIDRQLNTFAGINADVTGGAVLSTADLIVPLGAATDKVGIHIGKISIVP